MMWKLYYFVNRSKRLPGGKLQGAVMWSAARHPKPRPCPPICKRTHCHSAALQVFTDSDTRKTGVVSTFFRLHLQPSYRHSLKKKTKQALQYFINSWPSLQNPFCWASNPPLSCEDDRDASCCHLCSTQPAVLGCKSPLWPTAWERSTNTLCVSFQHALTAPQWKQRGSVLY